MQVTAALKRRWRLGEGGGHVEMLENWALHADKVGLRGHSIIFAAERQCFDYANQKWPGQALLLDLEDEFVQDDAKVDLSQEIGYHSAGFLRVTSRRAVYILHLLAFGFSVLYSDIDLAPAKPPPILRSPLLLSLLCLASCRLSAERIRRVHHRRSSLDGRPRSHAKALVSLWAYNMVKRGSFVANENDQHHLGHVITMMRERGIDANIGVLPGKKFPSGELMKNNMTSFMEIKAGVVMVHANYVVGKRSKIDRLIEAGVWLLPPPAKEGEEEGQGGEEGEEEMERRLMGLAEWVPSHLDAVLRVAPGVARDGPLILTVLCHEVDLQACMKRMGARPHFQSLATRISLRYPPHALPPSPFPIPTPCAFPSPPHQASVFTVPLPANAPSSNIIRQPASVASTGGSGSEERPGEKAEERDRLACLLMPALLASRLLAANITVLFSDPSTAWLRNPLPFLPATFSVLLPSTSHSPTPPTLDTTTPTPFNRSHLGSLSPWLLLLRPSSPSSSSSADPPSSHALALSWELHALKSLSKEPSLSDKGEGDGGSTPLALSVAVQSAFNHAIASVVEAQAGERAGEGAGEGAGGEGITIGVLPAFFVFSKEGGGREGGGGGGVGEEGGEGGRKGRGGGRGGGKEWRGGREGRGGGRGGGEGGEGGRGGVG
ncbi:unnamed protein product [Closterium sp. Naga37s-1]|nr:unnamed protein product [Closterium sp. Naga37s-1]